MYPHRIRLRGPWECEPLARFGDGAGEPLPSPRRLVMPCRWSEGGLSGFAGRLRLLRAFGYPGRLDAYERAWLTFAGVGGEAEATLNQRPLGRVVSGSEFEVTNDLRTRNQLVVDVVGTAEQGGLWGEVALEIRCSAYLADLRRSAILTGNRVELRISGRVVGTAERMLELYVLLDGSVVGYQTASATPEGQPFAFHVPDLDPEKWRGLEGQAIGVPVRVDLVNGAVVWYASDDEVTLETLTESGK
jgi:hypothetical protein